MLSGKSRVFCRAWPVFDQKWKMSSRGRKTQFLVYKISSKKVYFDVFFKNGLSYKAPYLSSMLRYTAKTVQFVFLFKISNFYNF